MMNNTAEIIKERSVTLHSLAREALAYNQNDFEAATDALVRKLLDEPGLIRLVVEPAIRSISAQALHQRIGVERNAIMKPFAPGEARLSALANVGSTMLLDMPLAAGVKLRDATRDDVSKAADRYDALAKDTGHKARWLRLVAQAVPAGVLVGNVVTEKRVQELFEEARHV